MKIKFVEIQNFRKLQSVRIDFDEETTIFVGANNSGKTSAMIALSHFLINPKRFSTNDFILSNWPKINEIGKKWGVAIPSNGGSTTPVDDWSAVIPTLDIWLNVGLDEIHHVRHLVPTLSWTGGLLGVRLRFEPKNVEELKKDYLLALQAANQAKSSASESNGAEKQYTLQLWPQDLREFLERRLRTYFEVKAYLLDPKKCVVPKCGFATPQSLPVDSEPIEGNPFSGLIRIDEIAAQRGLGDHDSGKSNEDGTEVSHHREQRKLSEQLKGYYSKHLDPFEFPVAADLDALEAIEAAQKAFDQRLSTSFSDAINELSLLNYPGVTDPKIKITTKLRPTDGLNHSAAVQYEVLPGDDSKVTAALRLPEEYNGLGYQNLISMVFRLMSFRDSWMRVGKAEKSIGKDKETIPPLHFVLVEEPEAHLHAQVQQVFVRKAYEVLRKHKDLGENKNLSTQLVVSTHSSHVAHESKFSCLRYFQRLPSKGNGLVPTSAVINLRDVFGTNDETERFVTRYLKSTHCDLFFADAAILVEGPAERILVPHFIKKKFPKLHRCYVTLMEIGGSHAHRFQNLIERLGLTTLIITDIDSASVSGTSGRSQAVVPKRSCGQTTGNHTLKTWHPKKTSFDELADLPEQDKVKLAPENSLFAVRVAYQQPIQVSMVDGALSVEALTTTFEDNLVFENLKLFKLIDGDGMIKKIKSALESHQTPDELETELFSIIRDGNKAEFALDLLYLEARPDLVDELKVPEYISNALKWLEDRLVTDQTTLLAVQSTPKDGIPNDNP